MPTDRYRPPTPEGGTPIMVATPPNDSIPKVCTRWRLSTSASRACVGNHWDYPVSIIEIPLPCGGKYQTLGRVLSKLLSELRSAAKRSPAPDVGTGGMRGSRRKGFGNSGVIQPQERGMGGASGSTAQPDGSIVPGGIRSTHRDQPSLLLRQRQEPPVCGLRRAQVNQVQMNVLRMGQTPLVSSGGAANGSAMPIGIATDD